MIWYAAPVNRFLTALGHISLPTIAWLMLRPSAYDTALYIVIHRAKARKKRGVEHLPFGRFGIGRIGLDIGNAERAIGHQEKPKDPAFGVIADVSLLRPDIPQELVFAEIIGAAIHETDIKPIG